jgi:hypothetical protein
MGRQILTSKLVIPVSQAGGPAAVAPAGLRPPPTPTWGWGGATAPSR